MKILAIILTLSLVSCARVHVNKTDEGDWDIKYNVLWRQIEEVEATVGDVTFTLGRASSEVTPNNEMVACLLAPHLCQ